MIRPLTFLAAVVASSGCATTEYAAYDPQSRPPPLTIDVTSKCLPEHAYHILQNDHVPTPVTRCAPRYPTRALEAGLTGSCVSHFTLSPAGAVLAPATTCIVGEATKPEWRAYGTAVFEAAARSAITRYMFAPEDSATWQGQRFAVRTKFLLADAPIPDDPPVPIDVVEIAPSRPKS